ncbi:MAG: hypothetical protein DMG06_00465 [Acidobacteria bacterium]|nr:MAG: hypothetical protein DMG06_00465 [Acidobacteriota bacterium]
MDVICLGILVADIFASPIDSIPEAGHLKLTDRLLLNIGGCAANTAADLRRLGRNVKVLGKVGEDLFGDFVLKDLERLGVDVSSVKRSQKHPTASTFILNVRGQDRRYIHCIGANADLTFADVDCSALDGARALYVGGYMAMPGFGSHDLTQLFREAKKRSLTTVLDVVIPAGNLLSPEQIESMLSYTDVFLPNDDEAYALTGLREPAAQADFLARLNPDCTIVITQGSRGALARLDREVLHASSFKVNSLDESGAGDAFAAGFLTGLLEGWSLECTLRFASAAGASCTRALGCTTSVFGFEEAVAFIRENPLEIKRMTPAVKP